MPMLKVACGGQTAPVNRVAALRKRHAELTKKIEEAHVHKSISDFYVNELKKQKLQLKDLIEQMSIKEVVSA
jgi:hypothetical protein